MFDDIANCPNPRQAAPAAACRSGQFPAQGVSGPPARKIRQNPPFEKIPRRSTRNTMNLTRTAYGTWNGGRYMNFGEALDEAARGLPAPGYDAASATFMTADTYEEARRTRRWGARWRGAAR